MLLQTKTQMQMLRELKRLTDDVQSHANKNVPGSASVSLCSLGIQYTVQVKPLLMSYIHTLGATATRSSAIH